MIADDHRAGSRDWFRIADDFNIDIENCSQEKGEGIGQPTDNGPAVRQFEQTNPQMHEDNEGEEECPERNNGSKLSPSHD